MVRLEVNTSLIVSEVRTATTDLVRLTLIIAAIALGLGILGAFILSTVIVVPIRKLVEQIEKIRDTEDKATSRACASKSPAATSCTRSPPR